MSMMPMDNKPKTVSFYDPKSEAEAKRKRQLAEILVKQGNAPVKNEMAGGMTVERSPWENINQGAQKYMGEFKLKQADDKQAELDLNRQQMMAEALSKFGENPQEAAMMLAQDPRYSDMAAKILQGEVDYGRQQERYAVEDAFKQRQLDLMAQRATTGGSTPAAMQVANRMYDLQTIASDPNRTPEERLSAQTQYNLIGQAQKTYGFTSGSERNFMGDLSNPQNQGMGQPDMGGFADVAGDGVYNIANETNLPPLEDNMMVDPTQAAPNNQMPQPMPTQPVVQPVQGFGDTQAQIAAQKAAAEAQAKKLNEAMPAAIVQQQNEIIDKINTSQSTERSLNNFISQIDSGQLDLNFFSNLENMARNNAAMSNEQSRNLASFKAQLEKLRNDSLRLNTGVQTEGDAQRIMNELITNLNDPLVVRQRLNEIAQTNKRGAALQKQKLDIMRNEYGRGSLELPNMSQPNVQNKPVSEMTDEELRALIGG